MSSKYFNDVIIGNKKILASFTKKGELLRLYYPCRDNRQYIEYFGTGVSVNNSNLIYLHEDKNNKYKQKYVEDTNCIITEIYNTYFKIKITQTDFVMIKDNILIKRYVLENENNIDLDIEFLVHSKIKSDSNNFVNGKAHENGIVQYAHDYMFCTFSKQKVSSHQINDSEKNIWTGKVWGKDYIGMCSDSSMSFKIGNIRPGEKKYLDLYITILPNKISEVDKYVNKIKKINADEQYNLAIQYWENYLKKHDTLDIPKPENILQEKLYEIYKRTILLYPLLSNNDTGGMLAAVEVDENRQHCGMYNYCWTRDGVFICKALDILNMTEETKKFYTIFCKKTQCENGMWEQRFYTDGKLAPAWGYQIDETASVVYGVYDHYKKVKDKEFLKETLKMNEKAIKFLKLYVQDILNDTHKLHISYDLWEMHEGINIYSLAAIYAAFDSMTNIYNELYDDFSENRIKQEYIREEQEILQNKMYQLKEYIIKFLYDTDKNTFVRNREDRLMDISILGLVIPFKIFGAKEKKITNSVEKIDLTLRTHTNGYLRFENDSYMNGNPWIISTLWMALYHLECGEKSKAIQELKFAIIGAAENGLLPEQVDNDTLTPIWVMGLGWSHAMFILVLEKLYGRKDKK